YVGAVRIRGEIVAGSGVGARTRATADRAILAYATLPLEPVRVAQLAEQRAVSIDVHDVVCAHVSSAHRQKAGRIYVTAVTYEEKPVAIVHAPRASNPIGKTESDSSRERRRRLLTFARASLRNLALQHHATIVWRCRGLDVERRSSRQVVQSMKHALELVGGRQVRCSGAAGRDDEEYRPQCDPECCDELHDWLDVVQVMARYGCIDLRRETDLSRCIEHPDSPFK